MGFFSRMGNLWRGFLSLWIADIEKDHPEIAYENAINSMVEKYTKLKTATAAIIRRREELEERFKRANRELEQTDAELSTALDTFRLDMGRYPSTQEGLAALLQPPSGASRWDGPYLSKSVMPLDPWDNPYQYRSPGGGGRPYDLFSFGADGAPGGEGDGRDISNWEG